MLTSKSSVTTAACPQAVAGLDSFLRAEPFAPACQPMDGRGRSLRLWLFQNIGKVRRAGHASIRILIGAALAIVEAPSDPGL